jgi:hypothetical protein
MLNFLNHVIILNEINQLIILHLLEQNDYYFIYPPSFIPIIDCFGHN